MRAVVSHSGADAAQVAVEDVARPEPDAGQVQVRVAAAAVNPIDLITADPAAVRQLGVAELPERLGLGWDLAGTISAVGDGVALSVGQPVIGLVDAFLTPIGAQSEYVVLDTRAVAPIGADADLIRAATLPLNATTALQALRLSGAGAGDAVVITGAAGAVGGYLVEYGARSGLTVIGVGRPGDEATVRGFGAAEFVSGEDPVGQIRRIAPDGVPVIIDAAMLVDGITGALAAGGSFVAVNETARPDLPGATVQKVNVRANPDDLGRVAADWAAGRLSDRVADVYPLEKVADAHDRLRAGGVRGRLVLTP